MRVRDMRCAVAVIGAGAAGLNAMDELLKRGVDAVLFADDIEGGTSLNSGSDKQTYYKLSLTGDFPDSVQALADRFFAGGGMQGCHARALAALSARSFLKLALLGVPFPQNEWGEYIGYQTDHDDSRRATSAGPLTSRMMAQRLLESVRQRSGEIVDGARLVSFDVKNGEVRGALFATDDGCIRLSCGAAVLATGGPAEVYGRRVYPANQSGGTGAALRAGAKANNLCYWQYGLASLKVRWNVSGSYQQAIPEYVESAGHPIAPDLPGRLNHIFRKGYQWPFDSARADASCQMDRAVKAVSDSGGRAYLDFTRDPLAGNEHLLDVEARTYLENCGALTAGAYERLTRINMPAAEFYRERGIDLSREPLEIAVCAQHANGGLWVDEHWQTSVRNLYAVGECSGVFGPYRPGGSALNETQVGSLRAAEHIADRKPSPQEPDAMSEEIALLERRKDESGELAAFQRRMDACAGAVRSVEQMRLLRRDVCERLEREVSDPRLRDTLYVQKYALSAMLEQAKYQGSAGHIVEDARPTEGPCGDYAFETDENGTRAVPVQPVPEGDQWFERAWKKAREEGRA